MSTLRRKKTKSHAKIIREKRKPRPHVDCEERGFTKHYYVLPVHHIVLFFCFRCGLFPSLLYSRLRFHNFSRSGLGCCFLLFCLIG